MARGRTTSLTIRLTPAERQTLLAWQRSPSISAGRARRGRIILLVANGMSITDIAATVGSSRRFVYKWVQRFLEAGLMGLADQPGRGRRRVPSQPALREQHDMSACLACAYEYEVDTVEGYKFSDEKLPSAPIYSVMAQTHLLLMLSPLLTNTS